MLTKKLIGALLLSIVSLSVSAEGFYAGGSIGFGEAEYSINGGFFSVDGDDTVAGVKGIGGYRVNNFLAIEANLVGIANDQNNSYDDIQFGAVSASGLLLLPASKNFDLFGRVGYYAGESEVSNFNSRDESGYVVGGGGLATFGARGQFSIRLEYEYFDTDELQDLWLVSGGFFYNFGQSARR